MIDHDCGVGCQAGERPGSDGLEPRLRVLSQQMDQDVQ